MTRKLSLNIKIDERVYPLTVSEDNEGKYRKAEKRLSELVLKYRQRFSGGDSYNFDSYDFLAMAAYQCVFDNLVLEENANQSLLFDELKKLNEVLDDFLSLKE